ncbi:hypothetical protein STRTUCAR8_00282, partial [Streptomyces turgidiscabies Car8]
MSTGPVGPVGHRRGGRALDLSDQLQYLPGGVTSCISFEAYSPARTLANAVTAHL